VFQSTIADPNIQISRSEISSSPSRNRKYNIVHNLCGFPRLVHGVRFGPSSRRRVMTYRSGGGGNNDDNKDDVVDLPPPPPQCRRKKSFRVHCGYPCALAQTLRLDDFPSRRLRMKSKYYSGCYDTCRTMKTRDVKNVKRIYTVYNIRYIA